MNIEKQVCTLQQSKRLKELGVAQSLSYFCWYEIIGHTPVILKSDDVIGDWHSDSYSAFTVAELGVMIGSRFNMPYGLGQIGTNDILWQDPLGGDKFKNEAEARACYLIFLLESGSVDADQVNERLAS